MVLWTKVQSCFKGWLVISQVDRATFHFGLQGSWTTCHQREIPHYPCQTQCSGKGHHLSLRLLLLWLHKKLGKVSSQNDEIIENSKWGLGDFAQIPLIYFFTFIAFYMSLCSILAPCVHFLSDRVRNSCRPLWGSMSEAPHSSSAQNSDGAQDIPDEAHAS